MESINSSAASSVECDFLKKHFDYRKVVCLIANYCTADYILFFQISSRSTTEVILTGNYVHSYLCYLYLL